ncbi:hypothetical protein VTK73DRAFT_5790 [Phialemonium thermophilum]|uniref:Bola-like protein n=1 Tax=Phialemonium thermophilum TaxID=223376 RepID=A0ABR3WLL6_9PEZI
MLCRSCLRARLGLRTNRSFPITARSYAQLAVRPTPSCILPTPPSNHWHLSPHTSRNTVPRRSSRAYSSPSPATQSSVPSQQESESDNATTAPQKPDFLDDAESLIWDRLVAEFEPTELLVQDISGGCGSMYGIEIASEKFRGVNMLKQQRMVNAVLGDLMKNWHGVQLKTKVP